MKLKASLLSHDILPVSQLAIHCCHQNHEKNQPTR